MIFNHNYLIKAHYFSTFFYLTTINRKNIISYISQPNHFNFDICMIYVYEKYDHI
jgi:hypothetical protein